MSISNIVCFIIGIILTVIILDSIRMLVTLLKSNVDTEKEFIHVDATILDKTINSTEKRVYNKSEEVKTLLVNEYMIKLLIPKDIEYELYVNSEEFNSYSINDKIRARVCLSKKGITNVQICKEG